MRRLVIVLALIAAWSAPGTAFADPAGDAETALRSGTVYVDPSLVAVTVDQTAVRAALPPGVKIAVLPATAGKAVSLATEIGMNLDPAGDGLTVGVLTVGTPNSFRASSSQFCAGYADNQAQDAVERNRTHLQATQDATDLLLDFAAHVKTGPDASGNCSATSATPTTRGSVWPFVVAVAVVGGGALAGLVFYSRRRRRRDLDLARAKVMPYYDRLANEIATLTSDGVERAQQALADASERFTCAGAQLAEADSVDEYALARRTVLEGLYAARTARDALGIDPGSDLPPMTVGTAPQLTAETPVSVGDQTFQGHPSYTPGSPYYFGGGSGVPGGWYGTPFWQTLLIGSVLSGGFSGAYRSGYDGGHDGGSGGGSGGGDWGGGSHGGGDWGGGSSGGGDSGGGSW